MSFSNRAPYIISLIALLTAGCGKITVNDVSGTYRRSVGGYTDTIILSTNGSFQQSLTNTNGGSWKSGGSWTLYYQQSAELSETFNYYDFEHQRPILPPKKWGPYRLTVEKNKLLANYEDPAWIRVK
jgi:hypothetical protein